MVRENQEEYIKKIKENLKRVKYVEEIHDMIEYVDRYIIGVSFDKEHDDIEVYNDDIKWGNMMIKLYNTELNNRKNEILGKQMTDLQNSIINQLLNNFDPKRQFVLTQPELIIIGYGLSKGSLNEFELKYWQSQLYVIHETIKKVNELKGLLNSNYIDCYNMLDDVYEQKNMLNFNLIITLCICKWYTDANSVEGYKYHYEKYSGGLIAYLGDKNITELNEHEQKIKKNINNYVITWNNIKIECHGGYYYNDIIEIDITKNLITKKQNEVKIETITEQNKAMEKEKNENEIIIDTLKNTKQTLNDNSDTIEIHEKQNSSEIINKNDNTVIDIKNSFGTDITNFIINDALSDALNKKTKLQQNINTQISENDKKLNEMEKKNEKKLERIDEKINILKNENDKIDDKKSKNNTNLNDINEAINNTEDTEDKKNLEEKKKEVENRNKKLEQNKNENTLKIAKKENKKVIIGGTVLVAVVFTSVFLIIALVVLIVVLIILTIVTLAIGTFIWCIIGYIIYRVKHTRKGFWNAVLAMIFGPITFFLV